MVHRRLDPKSLGDSYPGRLKHLEDQQEVDRVFMNELREAIVKLQSKVGEQELLITKMKRHADLNAKNIMEAETAVMKRMEENTSFVMKDCDGKLNGLREDIMRNVEIEITNKERFTQHLIGHEQPVLAPLVDGIMKEKIEAADTKIRIINAWIAAKTDRDAKVEQYLNQLNVERPQEGKAVENAFMGMAQELIEIRASTARGHATASTPVTGHVDDSILNDINGRIANVQAQVVHIRDQVLQGKCHCGHVEGHEKRMNTFEQKFTGYEASLRILETAVQQVPRAPATTPTTSYSAPVAPGASAAAAPGGGACECGPCGSAWASYVPSGRPRGPSGPGGPPGGDGGNPWYIEEASGGNGFCHCIHVKELMIEMDVVKGRIDEIQSDEFDPWADGTIGAQY